MNSEPIKSQQEADSVFTYLVNTIVETLKIDRNQAEKRVKALLESGLLDNGSPENPTTQMMIEKFLKTNID